MWYVKIRLRRGRGAIRGGKNRGSAPALDKALGLGSLHIVQDDERRETRDETTRRRGDELPSSLPLPFYRSLSLPLSPSLSLSLQHALLHRETHVNARLTHPHRPRPRRPGADGAHHGSDEAIEIRCNRKRIKTKTREHACASSSYLGLLRAFLRPCSILLFVPLIVLVRDDIVVGFLGIVVAIEVLLVIRHQIVLQ